MKIALKANNGKYVCAEQGGGLSYDDFISRKSVAPLYANRDEIGPWETFIMEPTGTGYYSIQCANGMYWSAENDGGQGISTNRTEVNAWEMFTPINGGIQSHDGIHYVCAELEIDSTLNATRTNVGSWETFKIIDLEPAPIVVGDPRKWKGNLTPDLGFDLQYGPRTPNGRTIFWTPSYVVYDTDTRKRIRDAYRNALGFTHFPLNLTNHSTIYRDWYPQWDDSLINTYLEELMRDGMIPVGYTMGDNDTTINCYANPDLVPIALGKWEDPTPIKRPALDADNRFWLVKEKYPNSITYWHNPPYQGAPFVEYVDWGLPQDDAGINAKVWNYMVHESGVVGLMAQCQAWNNDAQDSINSITDFALRLGTGYHGWPVADVVDYEETAYYLFNMGGTQEQALAWTKKIREANYAVPLNGFCNG